MSKPRPPKKFTPDPFEYHEEIELTIDTLTNLGLGLGRIDDWVVMVPFALPHERVKARVFRNHKNYSDADLIEVLEPSPDRIKPECPLFGTCGGCQYQNLSYAQQLLWKQGQVGEVLQKMAGIEDVLVDPVYPSPLQYGYRSKITPHFQKPRNGDVGPIGFLHSGKRFDIIDVEHCPIASVALNQQLPATRADVRERSAEFKKGATLLLRESGDGRVIGDPKEICQEAVGELKFHFPAGDFFQNNPSILPAFVDYVRAEAEGAGARFLVDAYCGSGLFSLACAQSFEAVAGVEVSEGSILWARENARINEIKNASFHLGSAESIFAEVGHFPAAETAVVIDPPRKGCSSEFLDQLFEFGPSAVVYVSCNPATQMRDLIRFRESGYELLRVQPFDLFPQTRHLECVITLQRRD
ncbi:MAG: tRNA/tmRNA/rRNA uracil-C5-methylase (TrmA/RlmC/RlmD family) [Verrucomicrobiales bacterium]|jgi:tRNA/tmRNA/rRNA uracil-C5-methylase (TrmA/RlmC/RlmD family)